MSQIPEFIESVLWIIRTTLVEGYRVAVEPGPADSEGRLNPCASGLVECPAACRGPDIEEFDDLSECMVTPLQVPAEHAAGVQSREAASP